MKAAPSGLAGLRYTKNFQLAASRGVAECGVETRRNQCNVAQFVSEKQSDITLAVPLRKRESHDIHAW